jgi:hypothetical protein
MVLDFLLSSGLVGCHAVKDEAGVGDAQAKGGEDDHTGELHVSRLSWKGEWYAGLHSLETDEHGLVRDDFRVDVSLAELVTPVDASRKNQDDGCGQEDEEDGHGAGYGGAGGAAEVAKEVVSEHDAKGKQDDDLEDQAGHGNVNANLAGASGGRGHAAAGGLEDEADNVGGDEDVVEEFGVEAGEFEAKLGDAATLSAGAEMRQN